MMDHCGTPQVVGLRDGISPFRVTGWYLFDKYDKTTCAIPLMQR